MATMAPSGLTVVRKNKVFTFSWKQGETYSQQSLCYQLNGTTPDHYISIYAGTTSVNITIDLDKYYPIKTSKLKSIRFWIRGYTSSGGWSGWSYKDFTLSAPLKPKLSANHSTEYENQTTFSWNVNWGSSNKSASPNVLTNYKWYTCLKKDSGVAPEKVKGWNESGITANGADSGSKTIKETRVFSGTYSYTRYFKIVARGPRGVSKTAYAKHVYATPHRAENVSATAIKLKNNLGYRVSVKWTAASTTAHPIDSIDIQYAVAVPASSYSDSEGVRKTTLSVPNISSWTTASTVKDTKDKNGDNDGISFTFDGEINNNECIFARVVTRHDNKTSPSDVVFVDDGYGALSDPSGLEVSVNNNIATVSVNNNSNVSASFVGIYFRTSVNSTPSLIGVVPAGSSSPISVRLPSYGTDDISFGARTFIADYSPIIPSVSDVTKYAISNTRMESSHIVWDDRPVPKPPENITLTSPRTGVVRLTWDWTWTDANGVELSWADHDDAWESTDAPQTYVLENTRASAWNVAGLDVGMWYFRIRLFKTDADSITYGTYSPIHSIKISASPATPVLTLSDTVSPPDGEVTCYWSFTAVDGDEQSSAKIAEVILDSNNNPTSYIDLPYTVDSEQYKTISIGDLNWTTGSTHYLAVKVITRSGEESENWSAPRAIQILEPIGAEITNTSIQTIDNEPYLTTLPLTISATGADKSGYMTYILERADDYHLDRPDESETTGFKGETVALIEQTSNSVYTITEDTTVDSSKAYYTRSGSDPDYVYTEVDIDPDSQINPHSLGYYEISGYNFDSEINLEDLISTLDDGASYILTAIAQDSYGQRAEAYAPFTVKWDHQAIKPEGVIEVDNDNMVVMITPTMPLSGYEQGDVCDIYRLSVDRPELIVKDAEFGTKYVDPYPTLGKMGGHRLVYRTKYGDYIMDGNEIAWTDYTVDSGDHVDIFATIIDFGDDQTVLPYDLSLSSKWSKDFTQTKYLGGSVEGDWNPAVERTGTVKTRVAVQQDSDLIASVRRLANYSGICHVRTPDGSSFAANINVSEDREEKKINMIASFTLEITRVDSEGFDGLTYDEWSTE